MVQIKYKGFVSNIYVATSVLVSFLLASFFTAIFPIHKGKIVFALVEFAVLFIFVCAVQWLYEPKTFKTVALNEKGIRCGKQFVKYENIETISIAYGHVRENPRSLQSEIMRGISDYNEMPVEDMICINCNFVGFRRKSRKCIYVPRNVKTDLILRNRSEEYRRLSDERVEQYKRTEAIKCENNSKRIWIAVAANAAVCIAIVLTVLFTETNPLVLLYMLPLGILSISSMLLTRFITEFLWKKVVKKLEKLQAEGM